MVVPYFSYDLLLLFFFFSIVTWLNEWSHTWGEDIHPFVGLTQVAAIAHVKILSFSQKIFCKGRTAQWELNISELKAQSDKNDSG